MFRNVAHKRNRHGQTLVEYGLIVASVAVAAILVLSALGSALGGTFSSINSALGAAGGGGGPTASPTVTPTPAPVPTDYALAGTASCATCADAPNVNDGNDSTSGNQATDFTLGTYRTWFEVDLGAAHTISSVRVHTANNNPDDPYGTSTVIVSYSPDDTNWTSFSPAHAMAAADDTWDITPTSARYWRITDNNKSTLEYWKVFTWSLFGTS